MKTNKCANHPTYRAKRQPRGDCQACWDLWAACSMTSHQLAKALLKLPDLPISEHEHGELLRNVEIDTVSTNYGSMECIALNFFPGRDRVSFD